MAKIYTKTGDGGETSLFGGSRVFKDDLRIRAYGSVDELNSLLGVSVELIGHSRSNRESDSGVASLPRMTKSIREKLLRIQRELMVLGADLATPADVKIKVPRVNKSFVTKLEKEIDAWEKELLPLKNFILPGGSRSGSMLHLARTVARRTERSIAELAKKEKINKNAQIYINRLSDWLFTVARYVNKLDDRNENFWLGRARQTLRKK